MENKHYYSIQQLLDNYNNGNSDDKLKIGTDAELLSNFYKTYVGPKEFLYIAPKDEIEENLKNNAYYICCYVNGQLAGIVKVAKLSLPYPFFVPPKNCSTNQEFWGLSGLYVHKRFRGLHLSTTLLKAGTRLAQKCGACGIYADFDYRNVNSMRLISKYFNLIGYTDGRNGSPDEATIYTTFFKNFTNKEHRKSGYAIDFNNTNCESARNLLDKIMNSIGKYSVNCVPYCSGYNIVVCFDDIYNFDNQKIVTANKDSVKIYNQKEIVK